MYYALNFKEYQAVLAACDKLSQYLFLHIKFPRMIAGEKIAQNHIQNPIPLHFLLPWKAVYIQNM